MYVESKRAQELMVQYMKLSGASCLTPHTAGLAYGHSLDGSESDGAIASIAPSFYQMQDISAWCFAEKDIHGQDQVRLFAGSK